ncbi:hypothetical protein HELRODRAFT_170268 [Helobdella robusta]|uniref:Uncharacterized protein n=1 Tax=Helobdella robusta TaxID=6412 RepID=T1F2V0_HELRO|nr:hypothetical protein HELRODRAFT_170268 [Helobdella robusta]ESO07725.1 hypothetical protein HELRODRAFT_170268 [Helobdella robusta]
MNHEKNKMTADSLKVSQSIPSPPNINLTSNITDSSSFSQTSTSSSSTSSSALSTSTTLDINDPCLSLSYSEIISHNNTNYKLNGTGDLTLCVHYLKSLLNKSKDCFLLNKRRCSIDGAVLPDINYGNFHDALFSMTEFFGFSEFFYTMQDILQIGGPYIYHHYLQKAKEYCQTNWLTVEEWKKLSKHPRADSQRYRLKDISA